MAETERAIAPGPAEAPATAVGLARDEMVERWIVENPHRPGADDVRVRGYGVSVWALIGHARATGGGAGELAEDYDLPVEAVEAALAYYERHRALIDERLAANLAA